MKDEGVIMDKKAATVIYHNTLQARFLKRNNRFSATVLINGLEEVVHVKNTGRLGELLLPDARVILQKSDNPSRKTKYDLISVYKDGLEWVNIDSLLPNMLMKKELMGQDFDLVKPEYTYGESRFDFYMERGKEKYLTEVKGCTLAHDLEAGIGLFPDAPTERGIKHLNELATASREGYHCALAFVIQMNGIHRVFPNDLTHPAFGQALRNAANAGVRILYYSCHVEADRISIKGMIDDTDRL